MDKNRKRFYIALPILIILPILCAFIALGIGRYPISYGEVFQSFLQAFGINQAISRTTFAFVINYRLPRILLALICGAGLAAAGTAIQATFSNPLAAPDTLGVSAGAGFGASLAIILGLSMLIIQAVAFVFGLLAVAISWFISKRQSGNNLVMIILSGVVVAAIFQALISLIQVVADPADQLPEIVFWLMGSFNKATYQNLLFGAPAILIGTVVLLVLRWRINILSLSENEASSLGLNVKWMRIAVIATAALITAGCVSMCGIVGWVGMLIPHVCRMIFGSNNKYIVPASISLGAIFMLIIDTLARTITAGEIPVSILTAIIGAPVFIILLKKTGGNASA